MDNEQQDRFFTDNNKTESELIPDTENNNSNGTDVNVKCEKDKIIDKFIEEVHRRHFLFSLNKSLIQKLVILNISRSSDKCDTRLFTVGNKKNCNFDKQDYVEKLDNSKEDTEGTLRKLLDDIAVIEDEYHDASNKNLTSLNTLKEEIRLKKESLAELKALFMQTKEKVALSSINSETGERFSRKDVKELLTQEEEVSKTLEEYQLHSIEKRHNLNLALEKKKNLAEGPIDFAKYETMYTETQNNKEIIQPISEEIKNIMKKTSSIINILSHLGQKLYQAQKEQTKASNTVEQLEKELNEMRKHLSEEKRKFIKMKHENKELQHKFVLLQHPRLIEDYNTMKQKNEDARKEVETLKKIYEEEMKIMNKK